VIEMSRTDFSPEEHKRLWLLAWDKAKESADNCHAKERHDSKSYREWFYLKLRHEYAHLIGENP
jgi:hypothetical protein